MNQRLTEHSGPEFFKRDGLLKGVLICVLTYGGTLTQETFSTVFIVGQMLARQGIPAQLMCLAFSGIVDVRNVLLTRFYDDFPAMSHILMIDNDMQCSPTMIQGMFAIGKPVVGTLYCRREVPKDGDKRSIMIGHLLNEPEIETIGSFAKVKHVGAGFLLIRRDVVTELIKNFPDINDTDDPGRLSGLGVTRMIRAFGEIRGPLGNRLSEDYSFCERWRQCGGEVWANYVEPIGHIGSFNYCVDYADLYVQKAEAEEAAA